MYPFATVHIITKAMLWGAANRIKRVVGAILFGTKREQAAFDASIQAYQAQADAEICAELLALFGYDL
jgi:hypothetical protein